MTLDDVSCTLSFSDSIRNIQRQSTLLKVPSQMKELDGDELDKLIPREDTFFFSSSVISIFATMQAPMRRSASGAVPCSRNITSMAHHPDVSLQQLSYMESLEDNDKLMILLPSGIWRESSNLMTYLHNGHLYLQRQRELLNYTRVLHWELPKLACECHTWSVMLAEKASLTCLL